MVSLLKMDAYIWSGPLTVIQHSWCYLLVAVVLVVAAT